MLVNTLPTDKTGESDNWRLSAPANPEALPMDQRIKQGYRMHCALSNLNRLDVDRLDDADQERIERARTLLEEVSLLTQPADGDGRNTRVDS